jgi:hypothetical protein
MPEKLQILELQNVQQDLPFQKFTEVIPFLWSHDQQLFSLEQCDDFHHPEAAAAAAACGRGNSHQQLFLQ